MPPPPQKAQNASAAAGRSFFCPLPIRPHTPLFSKQHNNTNHHSKTPRTAKTRRASPLARRSASRVARRPTSAWPTTSSRSCPRRCTRRTAFATRPLPTCTRALSKDEGASFFASLAPLPSHTRRTPDTTKQQKHSHRHGVHDAPGAYNQSDLATYTGGDNIFVTLASRRSASDPAPVLDFTSNPLPLDHMPGLHW